MKERGWQSNRKYASNPWQQNKDKTYKNKERETILDRERKQRANAEHPWQERDKHKKKSIETERQIE